jgi:hypothetical protein
MVGVIGLALAPLVHGFPGRGGTSPPPYVLYIRKEGSWALVVEEEEENPFVH